MSIDPLELALQRMREGAKLILWRMSSPWNWYLLTAAGKQHPITAETAKAVLSLCRKESDSIKQVPDYRLGLRRRGRDANMPESTQYVLNV